MTNTQNLSDLATEARSYLTQKQRTDQSYYYARTEDAPEWLTDLCRAAHNNGDILPDDWRYSFIVEALEIISECSSEDEARDRFSENEPSVYTAELTSWLNSAVFRVSYMDDALEFEPKDGFQILAYAQHAEFEEVAASVLSFLLDRLA